MSKLSDDAHRCRAPAAAGCDGKTGFATYALAIEVARLGRRRRKRPLGAYKCAHCARYHIGNSRHLPRPVEDD